MRMKMIPPPMEMGRLAGRVSESERECGKLHPSEEDGGRESRAYKCTAVMILDTPHWICITLA